MPDQSDPRPADRHGAVYSRRDFGKMTLAGLPAALALGRAPRAAQKVNSTVKGVQLGAITYSFRSIQDAKEIVQAYATIGLGEMELMSNHAEALAGAPSGRAGGGGRGRGTPITPEEQAARDAAAKALRDFRTSATEATFRPARRTIEDAGIEVRLVCYNMNVKTTTDDEIEYAFVMAKGFGAKALSTSTQVSMAKRLAPFAEKHKMMVGFHGHDSTDQPDEVHSEESFKAVMAAGNYLGANLDIGHYVSANGDPVAFLNAHHARITNLHLKDRKRDHGGNVPWGQGDTPIKDVLQVLSKSRWDIPANIEFEYAGDPIVEVGKCLQFCKDALA